MSFDFNDHADEAARKDNIIQRLLKRETELTERAQDWRYKYEQLLALHTALKEATITALKFYAEEDAESVEDGILKSVFDRPATKALTALVGEDGK